MRSCRDSSPTGTCASAPCVSGRGPTSRCTRSPRSGRAALDAWLTRDEPGGGEAEFHLRLFVGSLVPREVLVAHVERFRAATLGRLEEYRAIEPHNTRTGADRFHWFELRRAIERAEQDVAWADWVLEELVRE